MANYRVKIRKIEPVTHNVHAFTVDKPAGFSYVPGQATDLSIWKEGWKAEKRPFTFTSLPENETLEFTIKSYTDHDGVTNQLAFLKPGDLLEISDAWGAIAYEGIGVFLAGGAGVTPFIAILRNLYAQGKIGGNRLFFSNRTTKDIIGEAEFKKMLGENFFNLITDEPAPGFYQGRIDKSFLQQHIDHFDQPFYVCGPDAFTSSTLEALKALGAKPEALVFEK
ncbi:hypothetical protein GCM10023231_00850 [Olivibacter ginsenosidimutans]|uniref:FAD-binding FR-type domain-containing protein n=1 Tax=Olivibacter ginsenosidimutans TaxID=1176537 RepID=A0ABP9ACR5_9SPHI